MSSISQTKASQLIGTGALMVVFGSGMFALLYIIHGEEYDFGESEIFNRNSAFWTATPVVVTGLLGVLAGITKKNLWILLYMVCSAASAILAVLVAVVMGIKVSSIRQGCGEDSVCKNSDTAVILGTIVLLASIVVTIAIWACVKTCQSKWGPGKNTSSLHVVGEYRNGPTPSPTIVVQSDSRAHPTGEQMIVSTSQQEPNPAANETVEYESMNGIDSNRYEDVKPRPANKTDGNPHPRGDETGGSDTGYETVSQETNPRGERTGDDDTGYEAVNSVQGSKEAHGYESVQSGKKPTGDSTDKMSMEKSTGDDFPGTVEVPRDPVHDDCDVNIQVNKAYESDELTTAL